MRSFLDRRVCLFADCSVGLPVCFSGIERSPLTAVFEPDFQDGTNLYPVPLIMLDYRSEGKIVNYPLSSGLAVNNVLTRRMFLIDFVSGKVHHYPSSATEFSEFL